MSAIATLFGIGRIPLAPGTWASAAALPLAWLIMHYAGSMTLLGACAGVTVMGVWACGSFARALSADDPSECVIDELAGQWIACAFVPLSPLGFAAAFILFRIFDILKPWPVSAVERFPGGFGIMADDLVAGLLAGAIIAVFATLGLV